jgi:hypothetical protein
MMKKALQSTLAVAAALAAAGAMTNVHAAQTSANATATVVAPLAITKVADLSFGSFSTNAAGQTVTMSPAGVRSTSGAIAMAGTTTAATFNVVGSGTLTYAITLPSSIEMTTGSGGANETMTVSGFTSNPSGTGTLTAGAQTLAVGATLTTVAGQAGGVYSGSFNVSVDYN